MTDTIPFYLSALPGPAMPSLPAGLSLAAAHRRDSLSPAPERRSSRRRTGAHRKHVRVGETAVCPPSNSYPNPAHTLRRSRPIGKHRLIAWMRSQFDLSKWFWLQRDMTPGYAMGAARHV